MEHFAILPHFVGVAVHDGLAAYRDYDCLHGLCNAHHLRELVWLDETLGQTWPSNLIDLLCAAKAIADHAKEHHQPVAAEQVVAFRLRSTPSWPRGSCSTHQTLRVRGVVAQSSNRQQPIYCCDCGAIPMMSCVPDQPRRSIR